MPGHIAWSHSLRSTLLLMAPFDLLASLAMDAYLPIVPQMPAALETTPTTIQLTLGVYLLVLGGGQLVFGPLSDRFGRRPVLLAGAWLFVGASAALASTSSALIFLVLRIAEAAGGAAALVATFATVRDVYAAKPESTRIYSLLGAILVMVPAFGPVLGAGIDHWFGWRGIFLLLAFLGAFAALQGFLRWPETRPPEYRHVRMVYVLEILTSARFWIYTLGFSAAMGAFFVYLSTAPLVLINRIGVNPIAFSLIFGTVALVMMTMSQFVGRLVERWGEGAAGTATALYSCLESVIVSGASTLAVTLLPADTAWPLVAFCGVASLLTIALARRWLGEAG